VLACGASYALQLRLGVGLPERYLKSAQIEMPAQRCQDVEIYLGSNIAPQGFGWAVPVLRESGPHCRIGLMCEGDAELHFDRLCERLSNSWGVDRGDRKPRIKLLPLAPVPQTFSNRLLIIGDAAGRVKPSTGGGIFYSLVSARLASEVLGTALHAGDLSASSLQEYERRWAKRNGEEIEAQTRLRIAVQRLNDRQMDELIELARTDGILPLVRATARFNEHREFISALMKHPEARRILFRRFAASLS
jgi:flavin-dependent dehydrogenase